MKNKIDDVRDHLFAQLERLGDESLSGKELESEIKRAKAVREVSDSIINSAKAETDRVRLVAEHGIKAGTALLEKAEESTPALPRH